MTFPVSISERAETDLAHQYRWYRDNAALEVAENFLKSFHTVVARLTQHPELGPRRSFRAPELVGIRSIPLDQPFALHLVFYKATDEVLTIERVVHGARNLPIRLLEHPEL